MVVFLLFVESQLFSSAAWLVLFFSSCHLFALRKLLCTFILFLWPGLAFTRLNTVFYCSGTVVNEALFNTASCSYYRSPIVCGICNDEPKWSIWRCFHYPRAILFQISSCIAVADTTMNLPSLSLLTIMVLLLLNKTAFDFASSQTLKNGFVIAKYCPKVLLASCTESKVSKLLTRANAC